ncbi:MAG TPA: NAD(P)H-dependent glycerol-3-phosphate dehydrogenase [Acidimicrobiales bacterium]
MPQERPTVVVLGAGSWGTTISHTLAAGADVVLWARDPLLVEELCDQRTNSRHLPGAVLDRRVQVVGDLAVAVAGADVVLVAVPTFGLRAVVAGAAPHLPMRVPVVSLAKGFEPSTGRRMTEVIAEEAVGHPCGALTGPNLAREIFDGHAAASVLAMADDDIAARLQDVLSTGNLRVYRNPDVVGCELAGALKNVVAIAAGMAQGLGAGDNTRAAVITRGLAELSRLGAAMGGNPLTFSGLAGLGDLVATCSSPLSRNRHVGEQLGRGRSLDTVMAELRSVAEGVPAAPVTVALAAEHGVEVPIAVQVADVLAGRTTAAEAYRDLMGRRRREELYGLG